MAGRLLAGRTARPTHVVVAEEEAPELERWVRRDGDGVRFVPRSRPTISLELLAALRRGEVVAMQGDRALGNRGDVRVPFFGRPAPFPLGPFVAGPGGRACPSSPPSACSAPTTATRGQVGGAAPRGAGRRRGRGARAGSAILEDVVRRHPTQWFNFFDVWSPFGP